MAEYFSNNHVQPKVIPELIHPKGPKLKKERREKTNLITNLNTKKKKNCNTSNKLENLPNKGNF